VKEEIARTHFARAEREGRYGVRSGEGAYVAVAVVQLRIVVVIWRAGDPLRVRGDLGEVSATG
jgi:hypothetical protein